jgi:hypothetical protein
VRRVLRQPRRDIVGGETQQVESPFFYYKSFKSTAQCMREYANWLDDEEDEEMMTTASCLDWTVKRLESVRLKEQGEDG